MCPLGKVYVLFILLIELGCFAFGEVTQNEDGTEGVISFQTPTLNDEEAHSKHMPSHLKCDACTAIAFQLAKAFDDFHKKRPSLKVLPESEIYRLVDEVCEEGKELEKYGVKEVKKVKRLSGPGLEAEESPGIMQGGGKWPERMKGMCSLYVEEFDENRIYKEYMKKGDNLQGLLCRSTAHPGLTDVCTHFHPGAPIKATKTKKKKKEEL
ncbi:marginal zone B- and B1-cell-specific protein-like [Ruditapes philippinarum]|uniref:marginal zone B- and B1-cell-specific protein-like n=1 Tax=Ruditapes philippinarum TaxID=129788 RepID=UPI00295B1489|nr:marginal zone B- and B1-cell-specific protein-like [Ruditapes philippinarum]